MNMSATRRFSTGKEDSTTVKEESLGGSVCGCCGTSATGCCATGTNVPAFGGGCCSACDDPIASFSSCCAEPSAEEKAAAEREAEEPEKVCKDQQPPSDWFQPTCASQLATGNC